MATISIRASGGGDYTTARAAILASPQVVFPGDTISYDESGTYTESLINTTGPTLNARPPANCHFVAGAGCTVTIADNALRGGYLADLRAGGVTFDGITISVQAAGAASTVFDASGVAATLTNCPLVTRDTAVGNRYWFQLGTGGSVTLNGCNASGVQSTYRLTSATASGALTTNNCNLEAIGTGIGYLSGGAVAAFSLTKTRLAAPALISAGGTHTFDDCRSTTYLAVVATASGANLTLTGCGTSHATAALVLNTSGITIASLAIHGCYGKKLVDNPGTITTPVCDHNIYNSTATNTGNATGPAALNPWASIAVLKLGGGSGLEPLYDSPLNTAIPVGTSYGASTTDLLGRPRGYGGRQSAGPVQTLANCSVKPTSAYVDPLHVRVEFDGSVVGAAVPLQASAENVAHWTCTDSGDATISIASVAKVSALVYTVTLARAAAENTTLILTPATVATDVGGACYGSKSLTTPWVDIGLSSYTWPSAKVLRVTCADPNGAGNYVRESSAVVAANWLATGGASPVHPASVARYGAPNSQVYELTFADAFPGGTVLSLDAHLVETDLYGGHVSNPGTLAVVSPAIDCGIASVAQPDLPDGVVVTFAAVGAGPQRPDQTSAETIGNWGVAGDAGPLALVSAAQVSPLVYQLLFDRTLAPGEVLLLDTSAITTDWFGACNAPTTGGLTSVWGGIATASFDDTTHLRVTLNAATADTLPVEAEALDAANWGISGTGALSVLSVTGAGAEYVALLSRPTTALEHVTVDLLDIATVGGGFVGSPAAMTIVALAPDAGVASVVQTGYKTFRVTFAPYLGTAHPLEASAVNAANWAVTTGAGDAEIAAITRFDADRYDVELADHPPGGGAVVFNAWYVRTDQLGYCNHPATGGRNAGAYDCNPASAARVDAKSVAVTFAKEDGAGAPVLDAATANVAANWEVASPTDVLLEVVSAELDATKLIAVVGFNRSILGGQAVTVSAPRVRTTVDDVVVGYADPDSVRRHGGEVM